jgi:Leucine-rich repeat (LRR) protein
MKSIIIILPGIIFFNCKVDRAQPTPIVDTDTTTVYSATTLTLKSNSVPGQVFKMVGLRKLSITGMDCDYKVLDEKGNDVTRCWMIAVIPSEIRNLKKLEVLELRLNSISRLPDAIVELRNLRTLDLTDNLPLSNVDQVVGLENLEELILFGCGVTKLPEDIGKLRKLKYLGLGGNGLDKREQERIRSALPSCNIVF